jgi:hypothetical protein
MNHMNLALVEWALSKFSKELILKRVLNGHTIRNSKMVTSLSILRWLMFKTGPWLRFLLSEEIKHRSFIKFKATLFFLNFQAICLKIFFQLIKAMPRVQSRIRIMTSQVFLNRNQIVQSWTIMVSPISWTRKTGQINKDNLLEYQIGNMVEGICSQNSRSVQVIKCPFSISISNSQTSKLRWTQESQVRASRILVLTL